MARSNQVVTFRQDGNDVVMGAAGHDGEIRVNPLKLNPDVQRTALYYGIRVVLERSAAKSRNAATGKPASAAEKFAAMQSRADALINGSWTGTRASGISSERSTLLRAVVHLGADRESSEARIKAMSMEKVRIMLASPRVADAIRALSQVSVEDADGELDEFLTAPADDDATDEEDTAS